CARVIPFDYW
nr:immunoglobulin heavy chain junction region [Mus musculus]MBK4188647.1 immunoglobulin heavy chain junction region [Mus musculus]